MLHDRPKFRPSARRAAGCALLASVVALTACRREEIQVYRVPKEAAQEVAGAHASPHGGGTPHLHYKAPADWRAAETTRTRVANFVIEKGGLSAEVAAMPFPGMGGSDLQFVNLWREQLKLEPVTEAEAGKFMERVVVDELPGKLFDVTGAAGAGGKTDRIITAVVSRAGITWFFKLTGDAALVEEQKPAFLSFLKTVEFAEDSHATTTTAPRVTAGLPAWELPASWKEQQPPDMILRSFAASDDSGKKVDITVSQFSGPAGGLQANADRWRGQVGLGPLDAAELAKLPALDVAGGKATLVDVAGVSARTGERTRILGAIVPRGNETWFFKLMGSETVAERERESFVKFVKSVRFGTAP